MLAMRVYVLTDSLMFMHQRLNVIMQATWTRVSRSLKGEEHQVVERCQSACRPWAEGTGSSNAEYGCPTKKVTMFLSTGTVPREQTVPRDARRRTA